MTSLLARTTIEQETTNWLAVGASAAGYAITDESATTVDSSWRGDAADRLTAIAALPQGWDSHGGDRPNQKLVQTASDLLARLAQLPWLPRPYIDPTPSGGVQFEWDRGDRSFEIAIVAENLVTFLYEDLSSKESIEGDLPIDPSGLRSIVDYLFRTTQA